MYPDAYFDMVRVGISLYGCYPSEEVDKSRIALKPCMQLKTQIIRINDAESDVSVSYGRLFTTARKSKLATIPIGYADGISRVLAKKLIVLVNGQTAPVVGKICMDQCVVDITDVTGDIKIGDEVVIYGEQKGAIIPVEQVAEQMGTINYEILCLTSRRVLRYYTENGEITSMVNFLESGC
jgi:alanine racemase